MVVIVPHALGPGGNLFVDVDPSSVVLSNSCFPPGSAPVTHFLGSPLHLGGPPSADGAVLGVPPGDDLLLPLGSFSTGSSAAGAEFGVDGVAVLLSELVGFFLGRLSHLVRVSFVRELSELLLGALRPFASGGKCNSTGE